MIYTRTTEQTNSFFNRYLYYYNINIYFLIYFFTAARLSQSMMHGFNSRRHLLHAGWMERQMLHQYCGWPLFQADGWPVFLLIFCASTRSGINWAILDLRGKVWTVFLKLWSTIFTAYFPYIYLWSTTPTRVVGPSWNEVQSVRMSRKAKKSTTMSRLFLFSFDSIVISSGILYISNPASRKWGGFCGWITNMWSFV